jgi:hypothetical protein
MSESRQIDDVRKLLELTASIAADYHGNVFFGRPMVSALSKMPLSSHREP